MITQERFRLVLLASTIWLVTSPQPDARGESFEAKVTTHARALKQDGAVKLLLEFEDLTAIHGARILYANCILGLDVDSCDSRTSEAEVRPIFTDLQGEYYSWHNAPKIPDTAVTLVTVPYSRVIDLCRGIEGETSFVLTDIVSAWASGKLVERGLSIQMYRTDCSYELSQKVPDGTGLVHGFLEIRYVKE